MKKFALMQDGRAVEVIPETVTVDGKKIGLADRYHPDFVAQLVPYDPATAPEEPAPTGPPLPRTVTMRQARLALLANGQLDHVNAAIAALGEPHRTAAQIEWEFAATVDRESPMTALMAAALALDDAALDALFAAAAAI